MKQIIKLITKIKRTIKLTSSYGKVISNKEGLKTKFLENEVYDKTASIQHVGFRSDIPEGSRVFAVCNGNRENLTIIGSENKKIEPSRKGTVVYFDDKTFINIQDGKLRIEAKGVDLIQEIRQGLNNINTDIEILAKAMNGAGIPVQTLNTVKANINKIKQLEG